MNQILLGFLLSVIQKRRQHAMSQMSTCRGGVMPREYSLREGLSYWESVWRQGLLPCFKCCAAPMSFLILNAASCCLHNSLECSVVGLWDPSSFADPLRRWATPLQKQSWAGTC